MYDRILVPTDGAPGLERAVDEALALADLAGGQIHALSVVDTRDYSTLPEAKWLTLEAELEDVAEAAVEAVAERARDASVPAEQDVRRGVPHEEILAHAADVDADVVVMGTHGRSGVRRFLLGSVTEKVVRSADLPVLVVRIEGDE